MSDWLESARPERRRAIGVAKGVTRVLAAAAAMVGAWPALAQPDRVSDRTADSASPNEAPPEPVGESSADDGGGARRLDNQTVMELSRAGLGEPAVAALVRASKPDFDLSTPALLTLRRAGVESGVIAAMVHTQAARDAKVVHADAADPAVPHPPGVYVLADWLAAPRTLAIQPQATTRTTGGSIFGYALSGGLVPVAYRAIVPGDHAQVTAATARPTFYFYTGDIGKQAPASVWGPAPQPDRVSLVRFSVGKHGREVQVGSFTVRGSTTGIRERDAVPFSRRQVARGVIALRPETDLARGEYGFIETAAGVGTGAARVSTTSALVFAFAVGDHGSKEGAAMDGTVVERGPAPETEGAGSVKGLSGGRLSRRRRSLER